MPRPSAQFFNFGTVEDGRERGQVPPRLFSMPYWLLIGMICGALLTLGGTLWGVYNVVPPSMELARSSAVARLRTQDDEIRSAFQKLQAIEGTPCSQDYLAAMRAIVLRSYAVRDAAYRRGDDVLCSSGAGQVRVSISQYGPPLFRGANGVEIWRNVELPTAPGIKSTILILGNFSLMVAPGPVETRGGKALSTVLINRLSGAVTTINGPPVDLSVASLLSGTPIRRGFLRISSECVGEIAICLVQEVGLYEIWQEYRFQIVILTLAGAGLGALIAALLLIMLRRHLAFESRLRRGLSRGEVSLVYQPIMDLGTGRIYGAEALMRWNSRSKGSIPPSDFIAQAERTSLISDLTCFAVERASRELRSELLSPTGIGVSINIVPRDLTDPRFLQSLETHIVGVGIDPSRVALELTERQPIETAEAHATIRSLHAKGYKFYIDDFGTGHSNLSYLGELSVDAIKLDMIFTRSVGLDNVRSRLVPPILGIVSELNVTPIVEGIETKDQETYFVGLGVRLVQGWLYSRGVPADQLMAMTLAKRAV